MPDIILFALAVPLLIVLFWSIRISLMLGWMQIVEMWRHWWARHGK
ncbi:MAG: hypothetical protein JKY47_00930 [Thalassospira sp.]|jgi:hypothetical protein|nr:MULTISPECIES: hypothetical protein [unclassified Thalassospira]MBL4839376.1 hypothetical protein [Thalassospira sp.]PXX36262.1 hypothetical protein C7967_101655 [Thalassospira sp. 11-3]QPL37465.1 hypothetical protein IT971_09330 [Thalassospira sp. B30-1]